MQLLPIHSDERTDAFADIALNVCNTTFSFFTAAFFWGLLFNRRRAWRIDGGTAIFGASASALALLFTTLTFVYIPGKDQYGWLPGLMLTAVLWQSSFGWWRWIAGGMAAIEHVEHMWCEEKRRRKRQKRRARREERAAALRRIWHDVANALAAWRRAPACMREKEATPALSINKDRGEDDISRASGCEVHATGGGAGASALCLPGRRLLGLGHVLRTLGPPVCKVSGLGTNTTTSNEPPAGILQAMLRIPALRTVARWSAGVRRDHHAAGRALAAGQFARMTELDGLEGKCAGADALKPDPVKVGWGLGAFDLRERARRDEREREAVRGMLDDRAAGERRRREGGTFIWRWDPLRRRRLQDPTAYR